MLSSQSSRISCYFEIVSEQKRRSVTSSDASSYFSSYGVDALHPKAHRIINRNHSGLIALITETEVLPLAAIVFAPSREFAHRKLNVNFNTQLNSVI